MQLMLEVTPPSRRASDSKARASADRVCLAVKGMGRVDYLNVPEIIEENYLGAPLYKHYDAREFCALLRRGTGIASIPNKVVVYLSSAHDLESWIYESISRYGMDRLIFVGGSKGGSIYPGPSVAEANRAAARVGGVAVGNVCIPSRDGELSRVLSKTESGASFFTTQVMFESAPVIRLIGGYGTECERLGIRPAAFFISLPAPKNSFDIDFLKWLGADMSAGTEAALRRSRNIGLESNRICSGVLSDVEDYARSSGIKVPIGLNVEAISEANLDEVCTFVNALRTEGLL
ncbi:MAG: mycobacterial-type methylenetetrahydrofolate reductase [Candidatus Marsarchaeota archaeon]|jgi:hypothetical protein|nr:mycobacterial-type methylenetetrahydrofolate reductase [Candidatus Marsarchaeota archaeon]